MALCFNPQVGQMAGQWVMGGYLHREQKQMFEQHLLRCQACKIVVENLARKKGKKIPERFRPR